MAVFSVRDMFRTYDLQADNSIGCLVKLADSCPRGNSYHFLHFFYRAAQTIISLGLFILHVCNAIRVEYQPEVFQSPSAPETWWSLGECCGRCCTFHHACRALDGEHTASKKARKSASTAITKISTPLSSLPLLRGQVCVYQHWCIRILTGL